MKINLFFQRGGSLKKDENYLFFIIRYERFRRGEEISERRRDFGEAERFRRGEEISERRRALFSLPPIRSIEIARF